MRHQADLLERAATAAKHGLALLLPDERVGVVQLGRHQNRSAVRAIRQARDHLDDNRAHVFDVAAEGLHVLRDALGLVALLDVVRFAHAAVRKLQGRLQLRARALRLGNLCLPWSVAELRPDAELVVNLVGRLNCVVSLANGLVHRIDARDAEDPIAIGARDVRLEVGLVDAILASAFAFALLSARRAIRQRLGPAESATPPAARHTRKGDSARRARAKLVPVCRPRARPVKLIPGNFSNRNSF
jgi:hypothetical protein